MDAQDVHVNFGATRATLSVTPLGGNCYRLEETPLLILELEDDELWPGDVVDLEPGEDGDLLFREVISRSSWRHVSWMLGLEIIGRDPANPRVSVGESSALTAFKSRILAAGGWWEQVMGGVFLIHLPENSGFDEDEVWDECRRSTTKV